MKRLLLTAGVLLLVLAPTTRAGDPKAKAITVPFVLLKSKHMAVHVKIHGEGPYRLIFDTGAPYTLLGNKLGIASGVVPKGEKPAMPLLPGIGQYKIKTLEIAGLKAENLPTMVMDHPLIKEISKILGPVDGIIGLSFFARYQLTIDYQKKEMTFVPNNFEPPDVMAKIMKALNRDKDAKPPVVAPAGQWGFRVAKEAADETAGVEVKLVLPGSAAAAAGLKAGDRLLTLDGRWTDTVVDCYQAASHVRAGSRAVLAVRRGGKEMELKILVAPGL